MHLAFQEIISGFLTKFKICLKIHTQDKNKNGYKSFRGSIISSGHALG